MPKYLNYLLVSFTLFSVYLLFPAPLQALSLNDFFPAVRMKESLDRPPGEAVAPEVPSDDSFSNNNQDSQICEWTDYLQKTWEPNAAEEKTDPEGNPILVWPSTDAVDLEKTLTLSNFSNNSLRFIHDQFATNQVQCDPDSARREFLSAGPGGDSSGSRSSPYRLVKYGRGLRYADAIKSLDPTQDVIGMDEHILYACASQCRELKQGPSSGCRPVTLAEVAYFYYSNGILKIYDDPVKSNPVDYPVNAKFTAYPATYQARFGQPLELLDRDFYDNIDRQLSPISKGPVNQKITRTAYQGYETDKGPINPVTDTFNRNLPQAAASSVKQTGDIVSQYLPSKAQLLDNSDPCGNVAIRGPAAIDSPTPLTITEFIRGLLHRFEGPDTWTNNAQANNDSNKITTYTESQHLENNQKLETGLAYLIPNRALKETGVKSYPATSKVDVNSSPDPGYRLAETYKQFFRFLRPASWHSPEEQYTVDRPNTNPPAPLPDPSQVGDVSSYCPLITKYAQASNLDPDLIAAIITVESNGNSSARSRCGASGLMQVMPNDADQYWSGTCVNAFNPSIFSSRPSFDQLQDPEFNIEYGSNLLAGMITYWGSLRDGIKHYGPIGIDYQYADLVLGLMEKNSSFCSGS